MEFQSNVCFDIVLKAKSLRQRDRETERGCDIFEASPLRSDGNTDERRNILKPLYGPTTSRNEWYATLRVPGNSFRVATWRFLDMSVW